MDDVLFNIMPIAQYFLFPPFKNSIMEEDGGAIERSKTFYGDHSLSYPLPFYKLVQIPKSDVPVPPNPMFGGENCAGKIITGALMGILIPITCAVFNIYILKALCLVSAWVFSWGL